MAPCRALSADLILEGLDISVYCTACERRAGESTGSMRISPRSHAGAGSTGATPGLIWVKTQIAKRA
jgi:hypothetical protein